MSDVVTARLTDEIDRSLNEIAKEEQLDKSTVIRRLLSSSIKEWKLQQAIKDYQTGKSSTEQAAKKAGVGLWGFFHVLKERKVPITYDLEELENDLTTIAWHKR